jgi:hypothetical protein
VLVLIGVDALATIFSTALEIQKELHTKREALETLSSMRETADGLPEKIASFNAAVTEQKKRADDITRAWGDDLQFRIAQLNALLESRYRGVTPARSPTRRLPLPASTFRRTPLRGSAGGFSTYEGSCGAMRSLSPEDADEGPRRLLWQEYGLPDTALEWPLLAGALVGLWVDRARDRRDYGDAPRGGTGRGERGCRRGRALHDRPRVPGLCPPACAARRGDPARTADRTTV